MDSEGLSIEELHHSLQEAQSQVRRLEDVASLRRRQIDSMQQLTDAFFEHGSVDELIRMTLETAVDVLGCGGGSVMMHDTADDTLVFRHVIGPATGERLLGVRIPASEGIPGSVFSSGEPFIVNDVKHHPIHKDISAIAGFGVKSIICAPIKAPRGRPIGVITVVNGAWPFAENDSDVLVVLTGVAAAALEQARLSQEARKAAIVHLIGDISHDIKNMLTPIQTGVWTLQPMLDHLFASLDRLVQEYPEQEPWASGIREAVEGVRDDYGWILASAVDAADKVQERTRQIADAVKGELAAPQFEVGDINVPAREVAASARLAAEAREVRVILDLMEDIPSVEFDRKQVYNALYNLVNNAIPETEADGSVTIGTKWSSGDECVTLVVADTGGGMTEDVKARLFTNDAISTKPGGTGLGTKIVGDVVRRHHGTIEVKSALGEGTTFTIRLPLRQPQAAPDAQV